MKSPNQVYNGSLEICQTLFSFKIQKLKKNGLELKFNLTQLMEKQKIFSVVTVKA